MLCCLSSQPNKGALDTDMEHNKWSCDDRKLWLLSMLCSLSSQPNKGALDTDMEHNKWSGDDRKLLLSMLCCLSSQPNKGALDTDMEHNKWSDDDRKLWLLSMLCSLSSQPNKGAFDTDMEHNKWSGDDRKLLLSMLCSLSSQPNIGAFDTDMEHNKWSGDDRKLWLLSMLCCISSQPNKGALDTDMEHNKWSGDDRKLLLSMLCCLSSQPNKGALDTDMEHNKWSDDDRKLWLLSMLCSLSSQPNIGAFDTDMEHNKWSGDDRKLLLSMLCSLSSQSNIGAFDTDMEHNKWSGDDRKLWLLSMLCCISSQPNKGALDTDMEHNKWSGDDRKLLLSMLCCLSSQPNKGAFDTDMEHNKWSSKSVPASTRLEDPSRKGTTRTAKSAPFNPCPSREGPYSTVFSVSRPMDPLMWLAGLLALSGDVKTNPGPTTQTWTCDMCSTEITGRQTSYKCNSSPSHWVHKHCTTLIRNTDYTPTWKCNIHNQQNNTITDQHHQLTDNSNNMQQNLNINQPHSINNNKTQQQINSKKTITIIQININGLTTKIHELKNLTDNTKIDIITIQETKLKPTHRTPYLKDYTAIRTDRTYKNGGGLMTYIKNDIIFTELKTLHTTNNKLIELQHIKIHLANHKHLNIFNIYIPPRDTTNPDHSNSQEDITNCMTHILNTNNTILTGDFNAHHTLWHSPTTDNRGTLIADLINSSNQIVLNTNTPTRIPTNRNQQATSPDISTASNTIYNNITWSTLNALNSDHNPIKISYNTKTKFRLIQHRRSYTNYRKADWQGFTNSIENALTDTTDVTDVHKSNKILTLLLLDADKHYIPKGKIRPNNPLLPENIRAQIKERDIIKANDPTDNRLEHLNKDISQAIQTHRSGIWKEHLDGHWDHRQNTHILWKTINGLSNKKPTPITNNTITFKNYTAITPKQKANQFTKQFTNITKHKTKTHYRKIHRKIESLQTTPIKITIAQTSAALKSTKNTNSTGPDGLNIRHLKHLGPKGLDYLTKILNLSLNKNIIPQIWKLAKIIPIPKPNKDPHLGSSYRPISLLSPTAKLLEKIILPYITNNIPSIYHQHGFKTKHSTTTALHQLTNHITTGFNQKKPPHRTITIALDMSQAFDTVNHYTLIEKLINTNTPNLITRFIANYIRGRKAFTQYKNKNSFKKQFKAGVPQGGVLSPTLFNIYMSDLPTPPRDIHVTTYADDITIYSSDKNYTIAQQRLQPYLEDVQTWTKANDLKLNASKTMTTLFTPDPAEYRDELSLQLDNTRLPTIRNPKILGLTFDPKLTFNEHIKTSKDKAEKTINILKALTSTHWGKNKETLTNTYKTVTRPILEYAGTIYAPIISDKQLTALQVTQNQGLRIATGCTSDTNINHIHDETKILPIEKHLRLHSSQLRQKASHPDHPLHRLTTQPQPPRLKKKTIFNNNQYTLNIDPDPTHAIDENTIKRNMKTIHTTIVQDHLSNRPINKLLNRPPPDIDKKEETLPHSTRRKLSQLRTNKSPLLMTYLHKIDPANHPAANCPLCNDPNHDSLHLFNCPDIPTTLTVWDLWTNPVGVAALLDVWGEKLGGPRAGV